MNEEEKTTENQPTKATKDNDTGSEPETASIIDKANTAAERLEKANERRAELLRQEQDLEAKRLLGGRTSGAEQKEKPKEETPLEYKNRIMSNQL